MSTSTRPGRYIVVGAGAVGSVLAAQLQQAGIETVLVARGENRTVIARSGLTVRRPHGVDTVRLPVVGGPEELELRAGDVLALTVKTQDVEGVLRQWAWRPVLDETGEPTLLGADLPVLTFQNGTATEDLALRRFARVYGVTTGIAASHLVPGEVVSPSWPVVGALWIGRYGGAADGDGDQVRDALVADLSAAGWHVEAVADIQAAKARKLLVNLRNGLDVLAGTPEQKAEVLARLEAEATAVFTAAGVAVARPLDGGFALKIDPVPGHEPGRLSTWQSFSRGASSEIDFLNGEIVLLGRRFGVPAPVNERLQRVLGAQAEASLPPGSHEVTVLLDALPVAAG